MRSRGTSEFKFTSNLICLFRQRVVIKYIDIYTKQYFLTSQKLHAKINLVIKCYIFCYITFLELIAQYYNFQYFSLTLNFSMNVYKKFPDFSRFVHLFPWLLQYFSPFSSFPGFLIKFPDFSRFFQVFRFFQGFQKSENPAFR